MEKFAYPFTTTEKFCPMNDSFAKSAFTLAEVLITLGIIGIVAAMTMPALIQKNNNRVVETRLKKFYSSINQAVKMAEVDYGDKKIWYQDLAGAELDDEGKPVPGSSEAEKWFNKYLAPYMKIIKTEILSDGSLMVYFPDGSALRTLSHTTRDWVFFPGKPDKCDYTNGNSYGTCMFHFNFNPANTQPRWSYSYNKGFEPWKYYWDGTVEQLKNACYKNQPIYTSENVNAGKAYCTALIQINGWEIPDNYPYKVSY